MEAILSVAQVAEADISVEAVVVQIQLHAVLTLVAEAVGHPLQTELL